jgi:hypothetical protein
VGISGEVAAQVLNAGVVPRDGDSYGVRDGAWKMTVSSNTWSVMTWASRGDVKLRLESRSGSVVFGLLDLLRDKAKGGHQWVRRDGRGRLGGERGHGVHRGR